MTYRFCAITALVLEMAMFVAVNTSQAQSLDGVWEISAVIDDGRVVSPTDILLNYAADGRVTVNGQTVQLTVPMTYQRKQLPFVVDLTQNPARFDLAGAEKTGGRGIFLAGKDSLMLCLASKDKDRPASFSSQPGSGNLLVTLKRASTDSASAAATPQPQALPTYDDDQLHRALAGTWGHQDADTIHYITFNSDGSINSTMIWKDNFKKMFHQDVRSSGNWKVTNGVVIVNIGDSSDKERSGQVNSFRIRSINATELVAVDGSGQVRQEWKSQ